MSSISALSALQQAGIAAAEICHPNLRVREIQNASLARIHALHTPDVTEALSALISLKGIQLPRTVGESSGHDPIVMCLRPGDWLLSSEILSAGELQERLNVTGSGSQVTEHTTLLDVSDGLAVIRLAGAASPWLLAKLCGLDFMEGKNRGQHCARTRLGQVAVVVNYYPAEVGSSDFVYDLIFDRSIARYIWELLHHSADHAEELLSSAGYSPTNA